MGSQSWSWIPQGVTRITQGELRELCSESYECQLKTADLYNVPIDNAKKLMPIFLYKEKYVIH